MRSRRSALLILAGIAAFALPIAAAQTRTHETPPVPYFAITFQILSPPEGVEFTAAANHLLQSVWPQWDKLMPESAKMGAKGKVAVRFKIQKDGTISDQQLTVDTSSGKKELDNAAVAAIRASAPFERLPESFNGSNIEFRLIFFYSLPPDVHP